MLDFPHLEKEHWHELSRNPVVNNVRLHDDPKDAYGDPQVLLPGQFDDYWHIFFHGFIKQDGQCFHHMISKDGLHWNLKKIWKNEMGQSYVFKDGLNWIFYSSCYICNSADNQNPVIIKAFITRDFQEFTPIGEILRPELSWEMEGPYHQVRNPCVILLPNGKYRLYYCGGVVFLNDLGYEEPKYISYAESDSPYGPFVKHGLPILSPDSTIAHRTLGSGAIKVFGYGNGYLGFYNGVYRDSIGRSTSAINLLRSEDGILWEEAPYNPIILPDTGWRKAIVYQLDLVEWDGQIRLYYNARNEWRDGIEKIGLSAANCIGNKIIKLSGY